MNEDQINIINKINEIRNQYNIDTLKYCRRERLPEFILKDKTELFFYENANIFKLRQNLFILKCQKDEFLNLINNNEILNIITNDLLNRINIIEQNNLEFISIYNNNISNSNLNWKKNEIKLPKAEINLPKININDTQIEIESDSVNTNEKL